MGMRMISIALWMVAVATSALAAPPERASPGKNVLELYCTSCHALGGVGGGQARPGTNPPDLALLGQAFGRPLPKVRLLRRIAPPPHLPRTVFACGDPILKHNEQERFAFVARRGTVLEILLRLDGLQLPQPPDGGL